MIRINLRKFYCKCGCSKEIKLKKHHSWYGVPIFLLGHRLSSQTEETKRKISGSMKSKNKGKKLSIETIRKRTEIRRAKNTGEYYSEEAKRSISESIVRRIIESGHGNFSVNGIRGIFYSLKNQKEIRYESSYEL